MIMNNGKDKRNDTVITTIFGIDNNDNGYQKNNEIRKIQLRKNKKMVVAMLIKRMKNKKMKKKFIKGILFIIPRNMIDVMQKNFYVMEIITTKKFTIQKWKQIYIKQRRKL